MKRATRSYALRDALFVDDYEQTANLDPLERKDCLYEDTERFVPLTFDCTQCTTI